MLWKRNVSVFKSHWWLCKVDELMSEATQMRINPHIFRCLSGIQVLIKFNKSYARHLIPASSNRPRRSDFLQVMPQLNQHWFPRIPVVGIDHDALCRAFLCAVYESSWLGSHWAKSNNPLVLGHLLQLDMSLEFLVALEFLSMAPRCSWEAVIWSNF